MQDCVNVFSKIYCTKVDKFKHIKWHFSAYMPYHSYSKWVDWRLDGNNVWNREYPKYKEKPNQGRRYKDKSIYNIMCHVKSRLSGENL
jgi:hypothetical protein